MLKEDLEQRFITIETALPCQATLLDEITKVVIEQAKMIDRLKLENQYLLDNLQREVVKPLSEETPPPHY